VSAAEENRRQQKEIGRGEENDWEDHKKISASTFITRSGRLR